MVRKVYLIPGSPEAGEKRRLSVDYQDSNQPESETDFNQGYIFYFPSLKA